MSGETDMGELRLPGDSREADMGELRLPGNSSEADMGELRLLEKLVQLDSLVFPEAPWGKDGFLENAGNTFDTVLLATETGIPELKGYCILRHLDTGEILRIAVAPESRRRGIAAAMLKRAGEVALDRGCDALWLEVREGNAPARALYEKDGFAEAGRRKRYYSSPEEDAVLLKKELR